MTCDGKLLEFGKNNKQVHLHMNYLPCLVNIHSHVVTDGIFNPETFICDTLVIMIGGSPRTLCCQADGLIRHALLSVREWACFFHPWAVCNTVSPHWMDC